MTLDPIRSGAVPVVEAEGKSRCVAIESVALYFKPEPTAAKRR